MKRLFFVFVFVGRVRNIYVIINSPGTYKVSRKLGSSGLLGKKRFVVDMECSEERDS